MKRTAEQSPRAGYQDWWSQTFYLDALSALYRERGQQVQFLPYWYGAEWLPTTATADRQDRTIEIDNDSDFVALWSAGHLFNEVGDMTSLDAFTAVIELANSQRINSAAAMHTLLFSWGGGPHPHWFTPPLHFKAASNYVIGLTSVFSVARRARLGFHAVTAFYS